MDQEVLIVAFKPGFAEDIYNSLICSDEYIIENGLENNHKELSFFEKTYERDEHINLIIKKLISFFKIPTSEKKELPLEDIYQSLMTHLIYFNNQSIIQARTLNFIKPSTRLELYKRLSKAKDFMMAHTDRKLALNEIANAAMLSPFYFNRTFKELYKESPHQFHLKLRLSRAAQQIQQSNLTIDQAATSTGFENTSAFIRVFKKSYGTTPGKLK